MCCIGLPVTLHLLGVCRVEVCTALERLATERSERMRPRAAAWEL